MKVPIATAFMLTALPGFASTIVLSSPISGTECVSVLGTVVDNPANCSNGGGVAQVTLAPFAGVASQATAGAFMSSGGSASLQYQFEVVGGNVGDIVPLLFTANLFAEANAASDAFASITVEPGSGGLTQIVACTNEPSCGASAEFSGTFGVSVQSGLVNTVILKADSGEISSAGPENSSASADPLIAVDPSFAGAANYSIVLSPGVANAAGPAAPEPRSTVLLIGALAWLGWVT